MRVVIAAIGQRQPAWAVAAFDEFARRLPPEWRFELKAVKAEPRGTGKTVAQVLAAEAQRLDAAMPRGARRVVLDERGDRTTTVQLADRLRRWLVGGRDLAFAIGGPDGLDPSVKDSADERLRLSDLTLPHALVRVMLAEALYRAWTLSIGHPYHRE